MKIIKRNIFSELENQLNNDLILILIGPRQVGKTVFLQYLRQKLAKKSIFYFNLENEDLVPTVSDYHSLLNYLKIHSYSPKKKTFLLIDEFQKINQPTKMLKLLYDEQPQLKIIATGSSSLDIYQNLRQESLAGRKLVFTMLPLSLAEFLRFKNSSLETSLANLISLAEIDPLAVKTAVNADFKTLFSEFVIYGGYPRPVLAAAAEDKKRLLREIYNAYVQRDIQGILGLKNVSAYTKLVMLLAAQIGNLLSRYEFANTLQIPLAELEKYLLVLEKTFIIKLLPPFYANKRKEITKMPKIYFLDTGLRNWAVGNFSELELRPDAGALMENFVFAELTKALPVGWQIFFWRTKQKTETDFIVKRDQNLFPVEVKSKPFKKPIVPSGLKAFINNYRAQTKTAFVLTKDFSAQTEYQGVPVYFFPSLLATRALKIMEKF